MLKSEIAAAVSELTAKILRKDPQVSRPSSSSQPADAADWLVGGKLLAEQKVASYWLRVHVTVGTNSKDGKAAYLTALFKGIGGPQRRA